jgi:tetratricopeptide (TPR) repeat protein
MDKEEKKKQDQQIDIHVEGDHTGDISVDRHDTTIDQSVSQVTSQRDALIATGGGQITQIKKILVEVIPSWVWLVIFVSIFLGGAGFWTYKLIDRYLRIERLKFKQGEIGILVANFRTITNGLEEQTTGKWIVQELITNLRKDFNNISEKKVVVRELLKKPYLEDYEVQENGKLYRAALVVWGRIMSTPSGLMLYFTVQPIITEQGKFQLSPTEDSLPLKDPEHIEFESSLESVKQDVQQFVSFILGYIDYIQDHKDSTGFAAKYFRQVLESNAQSNNAAYAHFYLGNIAYYNDKTEKAEQFFETARTLKERNFMEASNNLGVIAFNQYEIAKALENFKEADVFGKCSQWLNNLQNHSPKKRGCVDLLYNLSNAYLENKNYKEGTEYADKAIKAFEWMRGGDDNSAFLVKLYNHIAYAYIKRAKHEQNLTYYEMAKNYLYQVTTFLDQSSPKILPEVVALEKDALNRNWARIYLDLKSLDIAAEFLQKVADPEDPKVHLLWAQFFDERCQAGDAIRSSEQYTLYWNKMIKDRRKIQEVIVKSNEQEQTCQK